MSIRKLWSGASAGLAGVMMASPGFAQQDKGFGQPYDWQIGLQGSASEIMDFITSFHTGLFWMITVISIFVLALLGWCVLKFNDKTNPVPSKTTHNTMIEVVWTVVPVLILLIIVVPSFRLLRLQEEIPPADVTLKVTGKQWYWTVEYAKDAGGFTFDAIMLDEKQRADAIAKGAKPGEVPRLLAVDNEIVVPVNKVIRVQVTAADVLHAFAMPSLGIKRDAVPGRLNETWFKATREGLYYGQCSELCGTNHAFMPAAIRVVSDAKYAEWQELAKKKYASTLDDGGVRLAASQPVLP
ncbi:MAG: cytochrome c oxidase subunit II [Beijerinckiaceae bacterium]